MIPPLIPDKSRLKFWGKSRAAGSATAQTANHNARFAALYALSVETRSPPLSTHSSPLQLLTLSRRATTTPPYPAITSQKYRQESFTSKPCAALHINQHHLTRTRLGRLLLEHALKEASLLRRGFLGHDGRGTGGRKVALCTGTVHSVGGSHRRVRQRHRHSHGLFMCLNVAL
jgi:hypothetical protein